MPRLRGKWSNWTEEQQLLYAAALFESRGSARVDRHNVNGRPYLGFRMRVRVTDEKYLDLLKSLFGGSSSPMVRNREKTWWEYRLAGGEAVKALKKLRPYMLVRGPELAPFLRGDVVLSGRADAAKA